MKWEAYSEGSEAWHKHFLSGFVTEFNNPYQPNTNDWLSWGQGWNDNFEGIWQQAVNASAQGEKKTRI